MDLTPNQKTAVTCLATGAYTDFAPDWSRSISEHWPEAQQFILSDGLTDCFQDVDFIVLPWGHFRWPFSTNFRHSALLAYAKVFAEFDLLIHVDVDAKFIGRPVLPLSGLFALQHPGYPQGRAEYAPFEDRRECLAYVPSDRRVSYFAGGFQGGDTVSFLQACLTIREWSLHDFRNGLVPIWHDESYWNRYCSESDEVVVLGSVEDENDLNVAGQDFLVFLEKDHTLYRFPDQNLRYLRAAARRLTSILKSAQWARAVRELVRLLVKRAPAGIRLRGPGADENNR